MKFQILSVLLAAAFAASALNAGLVVNDPIPSESAYNTNWSDGTGNVGYNAGTEGWSGDSDYTLSGAGGRINANSFAQWRGVQQDWGTALTGQIWVSVLMDERTNNSVDSGIALALENGSYSLNSFDGFAFGISGNGNLMTAQSGAAPTEVAGPVLVPASGPTLFVAKITVNGSGASDSIDLWAFDSNSSFGLTKASLSSTIFSSSTVQYGDSVQDVWVGGHRGTQSGSGRFDNIRISDLSGDQGLQEVLTGVAVPEPSTYALMAGTLVLGLVMVRRRLR